MIDKNNDDVEARARALATIATQLSESLGGELNPRKLKRFADICLTYYELGAQAALKSPPLLPKEEKKIVIAQS